MDGPEELQLNVQEVNLDSASMQGTDTSSGVFGEGFLDDTSTMNEQDRNEILAEIENVVSASSIGLTGELAAVKPLKNGSLFPFVINILAIASVVTVFYLAARLFENKKAVLNTETTSYISGEGMLLEELKRKSGQDIARKEQEILDIQNELARLDAESRLLKDNLDSSISRREQELRKTLMAELEEERKKLQAAGKSSPDIEREIAALESRKTAELGNELETFKAQAAENMKEKEEELGRAKLLAEGILAQANEEKTRILEETQKREQELESRYEEDRQALLAQSSEAARKLQEITRQQENENLATDQIIAGYSRIITAMQDNRLPDALESIGQLRTVLADPRIDTLPRILKRREVETFVLDTLEDEIRLQAEMPDSAAPALLDAAERLVKARALISQADKAMETGETDRAGNLYSQALKMVPELDNTVSKIRIIDSSRRMDTANRYLNDGDRFLSAGQADEAKNQFVSAAQAYGSNAEESKALSDIFQRVYSVITRQASSAVTEMEAAYKEMENRLSLKESETEELERRIAASLSEDSNKIQDSLNRISALEASLSASDEEIARLAGELEQARKETENALAREPAATAITSGQATSEPEPSAVLPGETVYVEVTDTEALERYEEEISRLATELENARRISGEYETALTELREMETRGSITFEIREQEFRVLQQRLQTDIDTLTQENAVLKKDFDAAVDELVNLVSARKGDEKYVALAYLYNDYELRLRQLISAEDYGGAGSLLSRFTRDDRIRTVFPGLDTIMSDIQKNLLAAEKESGIFTGRSSAFSDITAAASILDKDNSADLSGGPLDNPWQAEPRFREAVEQIRVLASKNLKRQVLAAQEGTSRFIGSISRISGDMLYIENLTGSRNVSGTRIVIKRISPDSEKIIAWAEVTAQQGSRTEARVTRGTDIAPRPVDLAYVAQD